MTTLESVLLGFFPFFAMICLACLVYYFRKESRKKEKK